MSFGEQLVITVGFASVICVLVCVFKFKQLKKEGKSAKHLEVKVFTGLGLPIIAIPFLMSELSVLDKFIVIILMLISGMSYIYSMTSARGAFRKALGLSPEDEDKEEISKEEKDIQ